MEEKPTYDDGSAETEVSRREVREDGSASDHDEAVSELELSISEERLCLVAP